MFKAFQPTGDRTAGTFPIFVYSHGFGGYPSEYQHLLTHVASWGFVVVSPVHDERGLLSLLGEPRGIGVDEGKILTDAAAATRAANAEASSPLPLARATTATRQAAIMTTRT